MKGWKLYLLPLGFYVLAGMVLVEWNKHPIYPIIGLIFWGMASIGMWDAYLENDRIKDE